MVEDTEDRDDRHSSSHAWPDQKWLAGSCMVGAESRERDTCWGFPSAVSATCRISSLVNQLPPGLLVDLGVRGDFLVGHDALEADFNWILELLCDMVGDGGIISSSELEMSNSG